VLGELALALAGVITETRPGSDSST